MSVFRNFRRSALSALALCAVAATTEAEIVSVSPSMVVSDGNGAVIGPVVGFAINGRPLALVADPIAPAGTPRGVLFRMEKDRIATEDDFRVYYQNTGCTGTIHLEEPSVRGGLAEMTGVNYAFGINASNEIVLFKGSGTSSSMETQSRWQSTSADFSVPSSGCSDVTETLQVVPASEAMNISTDHPPPYGVTFPGLQ